MHRAALYLRIIGVMVLFTVGSNYTVLLDSLNVIQGAMATSTSTLPIVMGLYQIVWWLITIAGGLALLTPHTSAKWLLLASFGLSLVGGMFVSWLPGASQLGALVKTPTETLVLLYIVNGALLYGIFRFSKRAT